MRKIVLQHETGLLLIIFLLSRALAGLAGVSFRYEPLFTYWQYLDVQSLQHGLLRHLWYFHAQPPVFNLFTGIVLRLGGSHFPLLFKIVWMIISACNALLLLRILKQRFPGTVWPVALSAWYLLSPATVLFENELFYTSFTSLLLLGTLYFLQLWCVEKDRRALSGFFAAAVLLCLSRTVFHLLWLGLVCSLLLVRYYGSPVFRNLVWGSTVSLLLVGGWYGKNAWLFGSFSASSWMGLNLARIVYHDVPPAELRGIATVHPFYPVRYYRPYIDTAWTSSYAGLDDRVLLREMKSDTAINMNQVAYVAIADCYKKDALSWVQQHPGVYARHAATAFLLFFTPASSYYQVLENGRKIAGYDLVYSFNLSHLVRGETRKKELLAFSAFPKFLLYGLVFCLLIFRAAPSRTSDLVALYVMGTILFVLLTSSLLEYGENMRFRYELEPAFLFLLATAITGFRARTVHQKVAVSTASEK